MRFGCAANGLLHIGPHSSAFRYTYIEIYNSKSIRANPVIYILVTEFKSKYVTTGNKAELQ